jgi:hypothetical protein
MPIARAAGIGPFSIGGLHYAHPHFRGRQEHPMNDQQWNDLL